MNSYYVYGLGVRSELPLPELITSMAPSDVTIRFDPELSQALPSADQTGWLEVSRQQATLYIDRIGLFKISDGKEVTITPCKNVRDSLLRVCILGPILGVVLYQRGKLVLHASALDFNGSAVAFMGGTGWGKSSLAAALFRRNHDLISDDIVAVELRDDIATVQPGFPRLKIDPEVAAFLNIESDELFSLDPFITKKELPVRQQLPTYPVALMRIYVLGVNIAAQIMPLHPQEAVIELLRHSYPTRVNYPGDGAHLIQCAQLVERVPMARLHRTEDLLSLPQLAEMVESDLVNTSGSNAQ